MKDVPLWSVACLIIGYGLMMFALGFAARGGWDE